MTKADLVQLASEAIGPGVTKKDCAVVVDAFLNAITLPVLLWNQRLETPSDASMPQILLLVLFLWYVDIGGWILSKALGRPYVVGVGIMLVYVLTSMALRDALFPVTT